MDNEFKKYKQINSQQMTTEDKIIKMRQMLYDADKTKEIALKLTHYIQQNK